jgi:hypothetical protein
MSSTILPLDVRGVTGAPTDLNRDVFFVRGFLTTLLERPRKASLLAQRCWPKKAVRRRPRDFGRSGLKRPPTRVALFFPGTFSFGCSMHTSISDAETGPCGDSGWGTTGGAGVSRVATLLAHAELAP